MEFLHSIWRGGDKVADSLHERKVTTLNQKDIIKETMKEILKKRHLTKTDELRLDHLRAQLDKIERYERWGV